MKLNAKYNQLMGFSLIELMVAIAVIGILAAVALPSYRDNVRQSNRAVSKTVLYENAQFMEQFYTENARYDVTPGGVAVALPFAQSPKTGAIQYNIALQSVANATFTLQAVPVGSMVGDACGTLTLTNTGVQGAGGSIANCWNR